MTAHRTKLPCSLEEVTEEFNPAFEREFDDYVKENLNHELANRMRRNIPSTAELTDEELFYKLLADDIGYNNGPTGENIVTRRTLVDAVRKQVTQ